MDPALWELLRAEAGADGDRVLEAVIRLARPGIEIPDIRIVSRFGTVATCRIRARDVVPVRARRDVVSLKAARGLGPGFEPAAGVAVPNAPGPADFRPADVRRSPGLTLTGRGVVVASVDWGVDVDSAAFRWPAGAAAAGSNRPAGGTRFLSFWDQRDVAAGPRPHPYGYGTVHDREQIDGALHDPRPYERLGYHPAIADRAGHGTHGTHVLDIAAGNGQAGGPAGIASGADLIFVHLADRTTGGLANLGDSVRLLEAVDFISRTAASQPCVINISAGRTCGPKDGTTLVERALDELLAATPGRFVVNSAGNYFGWRTHSSGRVAPGESRSLTFRVDPTGITRSELEIWYDGVDEFAVRIDPPGYTGGLAVGLGERSDLLIDSQTTGRVYHRKHDPNNGDNHIVVYIDPIGPAGNWTVTLEARQVTSGRFHAWIERDDTCRGCQARFAPADSNPLTTIGTITTSRIPLIVGAYDGHDPARPVAAFSSSGPSRDLRSKPDLVAPGVDVLAARSASTADSHNIGLLVRKSGTSMATPHVTGAVALCLEAAGNALSARQIRRLVLDSCDPARDPDAPYRLGRGYLNIPRLISHLQRTLTAPGAKEPTVNTDDNIMLLAAAPATAYREYLYRPHSQLASWIDERFDVVARPCQRLDQPPQLGDILLEIPLGQARPGHCLVLKACDPEFEASPRRLPAGQLLLRPRKRAEMSEPLPVEPAVESAEGSTVCAQARLTAVGHDEASARLITLLKQPLRAADRAGLQRRIGELTALFQSLSADQKTVLSRRLNDPADTLAHLFDCELHHESRRRLRALLQVPRPASPATQPQAEPRPPVTASPCVRELGRMTALLPWERSFLALVNDTDTKAFEGAVILTGPIFPGPFFDSIQKLIVTTALKHDYAITIGNNMWFPSPLDTSSVNHLGWLVHESVHLLDYDRVGIEAYLTSYIQKAVVAGFSHDDIPDERRANGFQSAALGLLSRSPELARLISTCDNDAILADLASHRGTYRQAVMEAFPEEHEEIERFEAQAPGEGTDAAQQISDLNRIAWIPPRDPEHDAYDASVIIAESEEKRPAQQWLEKSMAEFITYKRQVPDRLTDFDAKQLNVQVTSSYAKMFLTNPALFKWAGMAAFASHEVGNGMQQAWQLGFGTGTEMFTPALTWIGGLVTGRGGDVGPMMGKLLFWALSGGNRLVWADIFWQHVAYRDAGLRAIEEAQKAGDIPQRVLEAWTLIDSGGKSKAVDKIWDGNARLLMYEQQEVLQPKIYDAKEVKNLWKAISPDVPSSIPGHTANFTSYVPGGNIGVFADRWKWIFESMLPAWRNLDTNDPSRTRKLIEALK